MDGYKTWDQLTTDEKIERLHHELSSFAERWNEQAMIRGHNLDAQLRSVQAELKRLAAGLARLERKSLSSYLGQG